MGHVRANALLCQRRGSSDGTDPSDDSESDGERYGDAQEEDEGPAGQDD